MTGGSTVVPPGSADQVLAPDEAGPASAAAARASVAAPSATAYFGCASTTVGRPSSSEIIRETSGIRDEPPTSRTADSWLGSTCAERRVRIRVPMVDSIGARIMSSKSARFSCTSKCRWGRNTGIAVSVSMDSDSLASTQSWRSRAIAIAVCGSLMSSSDSAPPAE